MKIFLSKILKLFFIFFVLFSGLKHTFAENYTLFYGEGCSHCLKVERYIEKNNIEDNIIIVKKEIYHDQKNRELFQKENENLNISEKDSGVPFLVIESNNQKSFKNGSKDIIDYFETKIKTIEKIEINDEKINNDEKQIKKEERGFWFFLLILIPAALSDSINPCAFAVIVILLGSILSKYKDRKKVLISGLLFSLAIFISYYLMGIGLYKALATSTNTHILKVFVGVLGILVGIANLKDYFWYGKWFIVEVPITWRPKMKQLLQGVTSPMGAFLIGLVVSLFLLPCTSGPYITLLGYLSANQVEGYLYLFIYNLIFVLPMLIITFIIGFGMRNPADIEELRQDNLKIIHLIVGLLMLGLGMYVLLTL